MTEVPSKTCLIVENERKHLNDLEYELGRNGWKMLRHVNSMPDAKELARQVSRGAYGDIDAIFLDGNLTKGDKSGSDGWELSALFEQITHGRTFILPFTRTPENAAWGDTPASKQPRTIVRQAELLLRGELPTHDLLDVVGK